MLNCDKTVTLFHPTYDPDTGSDLYTRTVIHGVSWFSRVLSSVTDTGLVAANEVTVRVPESATDAAFSQGDILVLGEVDSDIQRPAELNTYQKMVVLGVTDNRVGLNPHWKVTGK